MADRQIGSLPKATEMDEESLLVVEQQNTAKSITGELIAQYAREATAGYVDLAKAEAKAAAQSAAEAQESAEHAEQYSGKPPIIQENDEGFQTWWTWDADQQQYVDTHEIAVSNVYFAVFWLDEATGELYETYDKDYTGPEFQLRDGADLEVVLYA